MKKENLVLEYSILGLPSSNGAKIRIYETGKFDVVGMGFDSDSGKNIEGKLLKEASISLEQVQSYVTRLVKAGFFDYKPLFSLVLDGLVETMTLNYQGKSRTINSGNQAYPTLFPEVVRELEGLMEQDK